MKLHLPKLLRKAVIACMTAAVSIGTTVGTGVIATGALSVAFTTVYAEDAITYSDTIYTWNGATSGTDIAFGKYHVTTVNDKGSFTVSEEDVLQGWGSNNSPSADRTCFSQRECCRSQ